MAMTSARATLVLWFGLDFTLTALPILRLHRLSCVILAGLLRLSYFCSTALTDRNQELEALTTLIGQPFYLPFCLSFAGLV